MLSKRIKTTPMPSLMTTTAKIPEEEESNDIWRDIIEEAHAPIFGVDTQLKVYKWNHMAETISGYSKTEVIGQPFLDFIEPEFRESVGTVLHKALRGENTANYQQQLLTKEGDTRILIINATAKRVNEEITGVVGIAQDITELVELQRKELARKEREWTANLMSIFTGLPTSFVWNFRGNFKNCEKSRFLAASDGCQTILGYTEKELCDYEGCIMEELMIPESYEDYKNIILNYATMDEPYTNSVGTIHTLKTGRRISINIVPQKRENGHMDFMGITFDVPDREQLELILDSTQELVMLDDGPGRAIDWIINKQTQTNDLDAHTIINEMPINCWPLVTYVSPSWTKFGYDENPAGKYIIELVEKTNTVSGANMFIEGLLHTIKTNNRSDMVKTIHGKINGIDVESVLSPMGDKILSVTRDVSERVKRFELEKQVVAKDIAREKDRQVNKIIRHETKNGLFNAISHTESFIEMHKAAEKDDALASLTYQEDLLGRYGELRDDLYVMLHTTLTDAMARDIINHDYVMKTDRCNLLEINYRLRNDKYIWNIYPRNFPEIYFDESLYFLIIRNAISNASKYGEKGGIIVINLTLKNNDLELRIENLPGKNHEKLLELPDPNIIFTQGTRLDTSNKELNLRSSGDGAWIISECSRLSGGTCSIKFEEDKTTFTYNTTVKAYVTKMDIDEFEFPSNTFFYGIDDSKMQRKQLVRIINKMNIPETNTFIRGDGMNEILSLPTFLHNKITNYPDHFHVIICDENLDYYNDFQELLQEHGSMICKNLLDNLEENYNILAFIRSANDSVEETEAYLKLVHGVLPKGMKLSEIKRTIAPLWLNKFGLVTPSHGQTKFDDNIADIIDIYMEDLKEFLDRENDKSNWDNFWSEIHKIKGSIQTLNEVMDGTHIIRLIEKLRGNKFNDEFDELMALIRDTLVEYQHKIIAYLKANKT